MIALRPQSQQSVPTPCAATVGFFDGVHRGHRYLIDHVREVARERGLDSAVVTFRDHPRRVLHAQFQPMLLSTPDEKMALLAQTGVSRCAMLAFDEAMAAMSARQFMEQVLLLRLHVRALVVGYDNRFGHNRAEGVEQYMAYGRELGMEVLPWKPLTMEGVGVSSSVVRSLLQEGEVLMAAQCLGYRYQLGGTVVHGQHVGTQMGFATANLQPDSPLKIVPAPGAYATLARIDGDQQWHHAMTNIGQRPTFDGHAQTIETHIFGHQGPLYDHRLTIAFAHRLRPERKFRSAAELANQLRADQEQAQALLSGGAG